MDIFNGCPLSRFRIVANPVLTGNDTTRELEVSQPENLVPIIQTPADYDSDRWEWDLDIEVIQISMKIWFLLWIQGGNSIDKILCLSFGPSLCQRCFFEKDTCMSWHF